MIALLSIDRACAAHHVRIVPVSGSCVRHDVVLIIAVVVNDALQTRPRVLDVIEVPPQVAVLYDRREVGLHIQHNI